MIFGPSDLADMIACVRGDYLGRANELGLSRRAFLARQLERVQEIQDAEPGKWSPRIHPDQPELALTPAGERIRARQVPMPPLEPAEPTEGERQLMHVEFYDGQWRMPRGWRDR